MEPSTHLLLALVLMSLMGLVIIACIIAVWYKNDDEITTKELIQKTYGKADKETEKGK